MLFKRHYDKYVALAAKYEEAKGIAYYLEERYHEVKVRGTRISGVSAGNSGKRRLPTKTLESNQLSVFPRFRIRLLGFRGRGSQCFLKVWSNVYITMEL